MDNVIVMALTVGTFYAYLLYAIIERRGWKFWLEVMMIIILILIPWIMTYLVIHG